MIIKTQTGPLKNIAQLRTQAETLLITRLEVYCRNIMMYSINAYRYSIEDHLMICV